MRTLASFDLLAAIDLLGGRVVRLREGDFARATEYSDEPTAVAARFAEQGIRWLHVVDLDGARAGEPVHGAAITSMIAALGGSARVEVAGGLRTPVSIDRMLDAGAARIVLGSVALSDPALVAAAVARHGPERVAVALDVRDGLAEGGAWRTGAPGKPIDRAIDDLAAAGVAWFEVTAIQRDGSLEGPDLDLLQAVMARVPEARIIAAGGIATVEDMLAAWTLGCAGTIVGRGLYEGTFAIDQAIRATRRGE
ncbi:MAG: 1-(5-phosphoribosyl)-5-[(5-phosphoribosylamino)methylideneamino] imidazole-4-carboxamide isomerase [Chloroflexi bacterium]|nr:1-(5-phosphoribosyl)-5-[(5-phosphoribosylamino)methylideneamino] imidazole-4-carboxamide isomerase [Chloroflexota bacterium]